MTEHNVVYRGVVIPEEYCHLDMDYIDSVFLAGIDAALDAQTAPPMIPPTYKYYRDEDTPENRDNYYYRVDNSNGNVTAVWGANGSRGTSVRSERNLVADEYILTPEESVPDWAKVD